MVTCPQCGTRNPLKNLFCSQCATPLDTAIEAVKVRREADTRRGCVGCLGILGIVAIVAVIMDVVSPSNNGPAPLPTEPKARLEAIVHARINGTVHFDSLPPGKQDPDRLQFLWVTRGSDGTYDVAVAFIAKDPGFSSFKDTVHAEMIALDKDLFTAGVPLNDVMQTAMFPTSDAYGVTTLTYIDRTELAGATGKLVNWNNTDQADFGALWQETPYNKEFRQ